MTYPNDNRPVGNLNRRNNWGGWAALGICGIGIILGAFYYSNRHNTTASNQSTSPATTTGSNSTGPAAPKK